MKYDLIYCDNCNALIHIASPYYNFTIGKPNGLYDEEIIHHGHLCPKCSEAILARIRTYKMKDDNYYLKGINAIKQEMNKR